MAKVFMYRHQRAGIVTSHVFLERPSEEQIAPIKAEMERLHGREGWGMIHEADLMGLGDVPVFPERENSATRDNAAVSSTPQISGTGTVTARK